MYRKNVAGQFLGLVLLDATTHAPVTGATVNGYRSIDGGAQAAVTGTISEKGNGQYVLALSQADINGDNISFLFTATDSIAVEKTVLTVDPLALEHGTAQAGAASTVTLASGASAVDDFYNGALVAIYGGTGAVQVRTITDYVGSTKVATVDRAWATNPDSSSKYTILAAVAPALNTSLQPVAASVAGAVATVTNPVTVGTNNDKTGYALSSAGIQAIWDALTSALTTVGSIGKFLIDRLDVPLSTRLASSSYTAPANSTITAIKDKTDLIPASPAAVSDIPTANQNADALLDRANGVETGLTLRQALRLMASALFGKLSGAATTTVTIRDYGDTKARITATVDASGNRTAVTRDPD